MRFLAAFFGASSGNNHTDLILKSDVELILVVSNTGGSITDLWAPEERSVPLALYTAASFLGPVIGPIVGGFISFYTSWRWYVPTNWSFTTELICQGHTGSC